MNKLTHDHDDLKHKQLSSEAKSLSERTHLSGIVRVQIVHGSTVQSKKGYSQQEIQVYYWRWVILFIYFLNTALINIVWIPSAPIADIVICYYDTSLFWVNALSEVYMVTYITFLFPVIWILDRFGLKLGLVIGSASNAVGAALKLAGTGSSYFWLTILGQAVASFSNIFIWTVAPLVSEVWFPARERATATAIGGAIAPQVGILVGLGLTPFIVHTDEELQFAVCGNATSNSTASPEEKQEWSEFVFYRLFYFNIGVAALGLIIFLLTLTGFRDAPPTPPSISRKLESDHEQQSSGCQQLKVFFCTTFKTFRNIYFLLYMIVAATIIAVSGDIVTVINEIIHPYFPDYDEQIGYLGITSQAASILAMFVVGRVLDWTKAFYAVNLTVFALSLLCTIAWAVLILFQTNFYFLYIPAILLGVSMSSFQAVVYEYAIEMTYPLPEGTSAGLINLSSQVVAIVVLLFVGHFLDSHVNNVSVGLWSMVGLVALACLITIFIRPELRRVKIDRK